MLVAMPVESVSADSELVPVFGEAEQFAVISEEGELSFLSMSEAEGGRDVARTLIANGVDAVIVAELGLNPYALLKTYGVKVYCEEEEHMTIHEAVENLHDHKLVEVTPTNFVRLLGEGHSSQHAS